MYDYGRTYTAIKCPNCNSSEAKCNTNMMLTSEPPQYACFCDVCGKNWYIFTYELQNYQPSSNTPATETTNTLEERVKTLERHVDGLDQVIMNLQKSIIELHQILIRG